MKLTSAELEKLELDPLLHDVLNNGWSPGRQRSFLDQYGPVLRNSILYQLCRHFGLTGAYPLRKYLESVQAQKGVDMPHHIGVPSNLLDLVANVWQDVLAEVFRPDPWESLVGKFAVAGHEGKDYAFEGFLRQSVRYKFLDNLPQKGSQKEIFDKIIDLEQEKDRRFYIQEARQRYSNRVADHVRDRCDQVSTEGVHNAVDYFFEQFVPATYPGVREGVPPQQLKGNVLKQLLARFSEVDCAQAAGYARHVYIDPEAAGRPGHEVAQTQDITLADEVDVYWDQLLRCEQPEPHALEKTMQAATVDRAGALCWACAKLKRESARQDTRDNVVAFIAFFCSQCGPKAEGALPAREGLTLASVVGRYFRWEEDVCQKIFGKNIRKDRVMQMVAKVLEDSPYQHLLAPAAKGGAS